MYESRWYEQAPWMSAAPVRTSTFVPLRPADALYNVQVDLGAIGAYGGQAAPGPGEAYLYSDYRVVMGFFLRRVGAGRSGYYRDAYLKGIGRTALAFNWWHANNYFGSGHLPASGAARELVVSRYFEAKGKANLINPCRGVLVADLAPELADPRAWLLRSERPPLPCDQSLQAITVKDADFARFSNVIWHLDHLSLFKGELDLIRFFTLLVGGLQPPGADVSQDIRPSVIARALAGAIERAVGNYREYWRLGVGWISVQTDLTMDGRYHDIDTPLFHGPGYLGAIAKLEAFEPGASWGRLPLDISWSAVTGFNVLEYLHAMRLFVRHLKSTLTVYASSEFPFSSSESDFIAGVLLALEEALPPDHILWSGSACAAMLRRWIAEDCEVAGHDRPGVDALVDAAVRARLDVSSRESAKFPIEAVDMDCARAGSRLKFTDRFYAIAGSRPRPERLEEARFLNGLVDTLDRITDRDEFCARALEAEQQIARHCRG